MMKLVRTLFIVPLFLMACSLFAPLPPTPIQSLPSPDPTIPPLQSETVPPLPTITPNAIPTNNPEVTLSAAVFTPLLYRSSPSRYNEFLIIGGIQAGNWVPAGAVVDQVGFEQGFDLYAQAGFAGVTVTKDYGVPLSNPRCGDTYIGTDFTGDVRNLVGVKQGWDVTVRPWREIPVNTPVYYGAVADWLISQGFTLPAVEISRILVVDLEGDSVDEVFISASHFEDESGHMAEQGDYSIILMRKLVGADVITVPVVADLYTSPTAEQVFPFTYSPVGLLDLNQDRIVELIVEVSRWEGGGVRIYEIEGTNVTQALSAVCVQ